MCYYITASVPEDIDLGEIQTLLDEFGMSFHPLHNASVRPHLPSSDLYVRLSSGGFCDCRTGLGYSHHGGGGGEEKAYQQLRRKGWTEAKIDRWLEEKRKTGGAAERERDLTRWDAFLHEAVRPRWIPRLNLLLHYYDNRLDEEVIPIQRTEKMAMSEVNNHFLSRIEENVIYSFRAL